MKLALVMVVIACKTDLTPAPRTGSDDEKFVDELVPADHDGELRIAGTIEGPLSEVGSDAERTISFGLVHNDKHIRVFYVGVLPYRFREHFEGAVVGRWLDAGHARPILMARGISEPGDVFDATNVFVYGVNF